MKFTLLLFSCCIIWSASIAQTEASDSSAIKQTINNLFTGMKNADTSLLLSAFTADAILQSVSVKKTGTKVVNDKVSEFARQVYNNGIGVLDEKISFAAIHIDGHLASVWTPYKFYYKGKFLHCGVNSFQFVKLDNAWKIQYLIDTRHENDCVE